MSDYMLSCCSTVDLSPEWLAEREIDCIYFNYELGGVWHKDDFGRTIAPQELYQRMLAGEPATTSQVATGDYLDYFAKALDAGKDIVHVCLSSGISGWSRMLSRKPWMLEAGVFSSWAAFWVSWRLMRTLSSSEWRSFQ